MTPRISPAVAPFPPTVLEDFSKLMPPGHEPLALFRTLAHNPRVLGRIRRGGLLDAGSITVRQRELVILRTTALAGAEYEWGVHVAFFAQVAGLDAKALYAVVHGDALDPVWKPDERALIAACDDLHASARVSDDTWAWLRAHFYDAQLVEVLVLAGLYRMVSYVINGAKIPLEPDAPRFPSRAQ
jgi:alkylhydroperoxidase family enzyme